MRTERLNCAHLEISICSCNYATACYCAKPFEGCFSGCIVSSCNACLYVYDHVTHISLSIICVYITAVSKKREYYISKIMT
jgi:hypothetical protein